MIATYIQDMITVEACQWTGDNVKEIKDFVTTIAEYLEDEATILVHTPDGEAKAEIGDYIFKGASGGFFVSSKYVFEAAYKIINKMVKIKVVNTGNQPLPAYATTQSAGMDLRANIEEPIVLKPLKRVLVPTGLHIALPEGYEAQIRPRSGLALKKGISCLNTPGTIDADYRGDVGVILINLSDEDFVINPGERIAQMIINKFEQAEFELVDSLEESERGEGGFGSTGTK